MRRSRHRRRGLVDYLSQSEYRHKRLPPRIYNDELMVNRHIDIAARWMLTQTDHSALTHPGGSVLHFSFVILFREGFPCALWHPCRGAAVGSESRKFAMTGPELNPTAERRNSAAIRSERHITPEVSIDLESLHAWS